MILKKISCTAMKLTKNTFCIHLSKIFMTYYNFLCGFIMKHIFSFICTCTKSTQFWYKVLVNISWFITHNIQKMSRWNSHENFHRKRVINFMWNVAFTEFLMYFATKNSCENEFLWNLHEKIPCLCKMSFTWIFKWQFCLFNTVDQL